MARLERKALIIIDGANLYGMLRQISEESKDDQKIDQDDKESNGDKVAQRINFHKLYQKLKQYKRTLIEFVYGFYIGRKCRRELPGLYQTIQNAGFELILPVESLENKNSWDDQQIIEILQSALSDIYVRDIIIVCGDSGLFNDIENLYQAGRNIFIISTPESLHSIYQNQGFTIIDFGSLQVTYHQHSK